MKSTNLSGDLAAVAEEIKGHARRFGLDFFEVVFELLDYDELNMVAAYGGFPTRYPHWKFGMEFERLQKAYAYGLQKIYELVINNDPCYAYLMRGNHLVDQKLVMAHVYAHSDFFKQNAWFARTNRKMMDEIANHGVHVRRHIERHGLNAVEEFVDCCLSIDNLVDIHSPFIVRRRAKADDFLDEDDDVYRQQPRRLPSKAYMDSFINPPRYIEAERERIQSEIEKQKNFPEHPERDVMLFLIENAKLERWQRSILSMLRDEAYYFAPQAMTKIMNEGWASYWHSRIMTEKAATSTEIIDYADHHSITMGVQPGALNPYKVGMELFRDIEERWNKGQFGPEWESCDDAAKRASWDLGLNFGRKKIFEVRRIYNDVTFIDEFLTEDFCKRHKLFTYAANKQTGEYVIESREFDAIKEKLLFSLTNLGQPTILVEEGNHKNRGELYLRHEFTGVPLDANYARDTLVNVFKIWGRPVHLETSADKRRKVLTYNGARHEEKIIK
jgi:stage V sporulation protein R